MPETLNELDAIDKYIFDRLQAQAGLVSAINTAGGAFKAFAEPAPRDIQKDAMAAVEVVEPPYVIWALMTSADNNALGRARIFTRPFMLVRAVTRDSSFVSAAALANYIDAALHNSPTVSPVSGTNITVMGFDRQQLVRTAEVVNGVRWNYVGGIYRGFVCRTS